MEEDEDWGASVRKQESEARKKLGALQVDNGDAKSRPSPLPLEAAPAAGETDEKPISPADASLLNKLLRSKLLETTNDVEVQQKDPNSPLYSVKSFEELRLRPDLLKGVYAMGFNRPSKIQEKALPILLADPPTNFIAQSQSGTGKTAAFALTMLSRVDMTKNYPQIICLSPTFDLAKQNGDVLTRMGKFCPNLRVVYAIRGERVDREKRTEQIVMGTAGTVLDWILKRKVIDPKNIKMFVLDEADVMIDLQGQQDQTIRIQKSLPSECQKVLFSATYSDEVKQFAQRVVPDAIMMTLKRSEESLDNIKQFYVECRSQDDKFEALSNLYAVATIAQAMIFCHTRKSAEWLAGEMSKHGHAVALITGDSAPEQRIAVLNRFRDGKEKVLITTNLCARGIDVEAVSVVINYDIPIDANKLPDCETYLHRIGRTGRFGRNGLAINFVDGPRSKKNLDSIQQHFNKPVLKLDTSDFDSLEKALSA